MKRNSLIVIFILIAFLGGAPGAEASMSNPAATRSGPGQLPFIVSAPPPPPEGEPDPETTLLVAAIERRIRTHPNTFLRVVRDTLELQNAQRSSDEQWGLAWLVLTDPQSGQPLPAEPALALAHNAGDGWEAALPGEPNWRDWLSSLPPDLLSPENQAAWLALDQQVAAARSALAETPLRGYKLPWRAGQTVSLSRSVAHDADITSGNAHFAFDFYISKTMFDIHAARSGRVYLYRDDVPNDEHSAVNYLVLEDTSTSPTTYQLYLHLAQNSIPPALKSVGAPVTQGQFIAIADNTGQSTGHHLHFQVQTLPYWTYWGISQDVVFDEVVINGGRPRVSWDEPYCRSTDICTTFQNSYVSANVPPTDLGAPWGDLLSPANGVTISSPTLGISGWAADAETGLASIQLIANWSGAWVPLGPSTTSSPVNYEWDWCAAGVPDGPVSLALEIRDEEGNLGPDLAGLRHILKNDACPASPPACQPGAEQVALFNEPDYQGSCIVLGLGAHGTTSLAALGDNQAASLQVGSQVYATLYQESGFSGRSITFPPLDASGNGDSNLADDRLGADQLSSLRVTRRSAAPSTPLLLWPADSTSIPAGVSLSLAAQDSGGGLQFLLDFNGVLQTWQSEPVFSLPITVPGVYMWRVKARNAAGESSWSAYNKLTVSSPSAPDAVQVSAPFSDDMEGDAGGWTHTNFWDQTSSLNHTTGGAVSWNYDTNSADGYDTGSPHAGDLTSPAIQIPAAGYYLRFWYWYETESDGLHWDRRWLQISVGSSEFTNFYQFNQDPPRTWLSSPAFDLSAYAGQSIRFRFHFETLDEYANGFAGWFIDDFSVANQPPPLCDPAQEPNNLPDQALDLHFGDSQAGIICPGGDQDWYRLALSAGQQIGLSLNAQVDGSSLDTYLSLYDSDGRSLLAYNDDIQSGVLTDSRLSYRTLRDGVYYVQVRAWNHPSAGGTDYTYSLSAAVGAGEPTAELVNPPSNTFLSPTQAMLEVSADDPAGVLSHVEFYWHSGDWRSGNWIYLGSDSSSADGWTFSLDTSALTDQRDIAVYARVFDQAGNWLPLAAWGLALDRTAPQSSLNPAPSPVNSTAVQLSWTGSDNLSGIAYFDLQRQLVGGSWVDWLTAIPGDRLSAWGLLTPGGSYNFRLRAVDRIGNQELYPLLAETSLSLPDKLCLEPDGWEPDNTPAAASAHTPGEFTWEHNFCNPSISSGIEDRDWRRLTLNAGLPVTLSAIPLGGGAAARLSLYTADGSQVLAQASSPELAQTATLQYLPASTGDYLLEVAPLLDALAGDAARYRLLLRAGYPLYLPIIGH